MPGGVAVEAGVDGAGRRGLAPNDTEDGRAVNRRVDLVKQ
jgi:flagellar motor protein MotB